MLDKGVIRKEYADRRVFLKNYQILRNLLHIDDNSHIVFVYLRDNGTMTDKIEEIRECMLTEQYKDRFKYIDWHSFFEKVTVKLDFANDERLKRHYDEFRMKYLNY